MSEEIKEILGYLKYVSNDIKVHIKDENIIAKEIPSSMIKELSLNSYSANILLNYITNLQQKVEQLEKEKYPFYNDDIRDIIVERDGFYEQVQELENIRKEAIDYITTEQLYTNYQWEKSQYVKY